MPQSTVDDLIALGFNLDQTAATLGKVDNILSIYGQLRNTAAAPRAAVPHGPPATPWTRTKHKGDTAAATAPTTCGSIGDISRTGTGGRGACTPPEQ